MSSILEPYSIDWLPRSVMGRLGGRVGFSYAPGKHDRAPMSPDLGGRRDLARDLWRIEKVHRVRVIISLMERFEYQLLGIPFNRYRNAIRKTRMVFRDYPIPDRDVPADYETFDQLVSWASAQLGLGRRVLVHCRWGRGRSALTAACIATVLGLHPSDAIKHVRRINEKALRRPNQVDFTHSYHAYMKGLTLDKSRAAW